MSIAATIPSDKSKLYPSPFENNPDAYVSSKTSILLLTLLFTTTSESVVEAINLLNFSCSDKKKFILAIAIESTPPQTGGMVPKLTFAPFSFRNSPFSILT